MALVDDETKLLDYIVYLYDFSIGLLPRSGLVILPDFWLVVVVEEAAAGSCERGDWGMIIGSIPLWGKLKPVLRSI